MVRKLSLAIAVALGVSSFGVNALGLGALHSKSALNEYFNADIELLSLDQEELDDVKVKLAPAEAFRNAGIERPFYLSQLKFKPMRLPDGRGVIRVTSRDPVREPFLDFLVEVNWPKGRLLREYTVLLDPPVTLARRPAPVSKPRAAVERPVPRETAARQASPAPSMPAYTEGEYGPTRRNDTLWGIASRVRNRGVTQEQMMMSLFQANPDAFIGRNINKLKVGEILRVPTREESQAMTAAEARQAFRSQLNEWRAPSPARQEVAATSVEAPVAPAAEATTAPEAELKIATPRPEGEGEAGPGESKDPAAVVELLKQELLASEEAKQSALEEGKELQSRVKDLEAQLSDLQRLVTLQNNQLAQLQVALGDVAAAQAPAEQAADGEPAAETGAMDEAAAPQQPEPEQEAIAAEQQATEAEPEAVVTGEADVAAADTMATQIEEETPAGEGPIAEPGEADAAAIAAGATLAQETTAVEMADAGTDAGLAVTDQEEIALEAGDVEEPVIEDEGDVLAGADSTSAATGAEETLVAETGNAVEEPLAPETVVEAQPEPATEAAPPVVAEAPTSVKATKPTLLEKLTADPNLMMGAAAGGGVILLAIVWAALSRRRRARNDEFEESILVNTIGEEGDEVPLVAGGPTSHPTEETSFLSDFSPSDIDALQEETGEVDPVAEADVYIAYGRYKQAEELIRQALERDPERTDLKLKLAEVLYATKDEEAFLELAEQAAESGMANENPEGWEKLVSMGSKIAPSSQLFATGAVSIIANELQAPEAQDSTAATAAIDELDLGELASDLDAGGEAFEGLDDLDNLNLGDLSDLGEVAEIDDQAKDADALDNGLDFELDLGSGQDVDTREMATAENEDEEPAFDLGSLEDTGTLSLDDLTSELVDTEDEAPLELPEDVDEDTLSQVAEELEETVIDFSGNEQATVAEQALDGLDLGDEKVPVELTAEFDVTTAASEEVEILSLEQAETGESELLADEGMPEGDEVNTKLDLARAYVDMGDSEGARSILDEVVEEGNETQQGAARKLMEALG